MNRPITLKIDVTKIAKEHLFRGEKGVYLDVAIWPKKDGTGQYGDTHYAVQQVTKEKRTAGVRGPIIGNATVPTDEPAQQERTSSSPAADIAPDDIPF